MKTSRKSFPLFNLGLLLSLQLLIGSTLFSYFRSCESTVARLNADGSIDTSFVADGSFKGDFYAYVVPLADGKMLVVGGFSEYGGGKCVAIARLNADGRLDSTFRPDTIYTCSTSEIVLLSDGKILVNPSYPVTSGEDSISRQLMRLYRDQLFRLNQDGSLDEGFYVGEGAKIGKYGWPSIYDVVVQQDGKLLVVGSFDSYNGVDCYGMLRLQTNGSLDSTFSVTEPVIYSSGKIALQPDGKIILLKAIERK
jgi:uncharacterized delta-60 repeat protein